MNPNEYKYKLTLVRSVSRFMLTKWQPSRLICAHEMCQLKNHLPLSVPTRCLLCCNVFWAVSSYIQLESFKNERNGTSCYIVVNEGSFLSSNNSKFYLFFPCFFLLRLDLYVHLNEAHFLLLLKISYKVILCTQIER